MRRIGALVVALALVAALLPTAGSADVRKWPSQGFSLIFEDGTALTFGPTSGLDLESAFGVGMPPVDNITTPYAILDGSVWQRSITRNRTITLVIRANGKSIYGLQVLRSKLIEAVNPHRVTLPVRLQYQGASRILYIECYYAGGLELPGEVRTGFERIALQLLCNDPYWYADASTTAALSVRQVIANTNYIEQRSPTGVWSNMVNGADGAVRCFAFDQSGRLYAGGAFHNIGGVAAAHIARWTGTAWQALGAGCDDDVYTLSLGVDGNIYIGGRFHNAGGAAAAHIVRYNVLAATWSTLGAGCDDYVTDIVHANSGLVYVGGAFLNAGGAAALRIAAWNGAVWAPVGAGLSGPVNEMCIGKDNALYAVGSFATVAGPGITLNGIGRWNGTAWSALGTGFTDPGIMAGSAICPLPDGRIVVGGNFETAGGIAALHVAVWNGASWAPMGTGFNSDVFTLYLDTLGQLRATGNFTTSGAGSYAFPMAHAIWRSPIWVAAESAGFAGGGFILYELGIGTSVGGPVTLETRGYIWSGGTFTGALSHPGDNALTNAGSANVYPIFTFVGPGPLYHIINYTTGKRIDFNVTLLANETAVLDLRPGIKTFVSNFRGNLANAVLPSDLTTWALAPGVNHVTVWIDNAAGTGSMAYHTRYWSIDGATD